FFFHHRNRDLLIAFDAPCARSLVRHTCRRGTRLLLGCTRRARRAPPCRGRPSSGVIAGPALLPPLRRPLVEVDRVQASQDLHAPLSPVIAALDHHECTASADSLSIGVRLLMRHTEVDERIKKVISLVGGVSLDGCVLGLATFGVVKSQMNIAPCKAVLEQFLHDTLGVCARVIECDQCLCHTTSPSFMFISVRYTLNLYLFA